MQYVYQHEWHAETHLQLKDGEYSKDNALLMADVLHKDEPEQAEKLKQVVELCTVEGKPDNSKPK